MKPMSEALSAYLAAARLSSAPMLMAECFQFTLASGTNLYYANTDLPVTLDGIVYVANSILVEGLKYKSDRTLSVDTQKIVISAVASDSASGLLMSAIADGILDGAILTRRRAFLASWTSPAIGGVTMFVGRIATIDEIGRLTATVTVNSDLAFLDIDMPKNLFSSTCAWTLYGVGCGAIKAAFTSTGVVGAGSTASAIQWSSATPQYAQGRLIFLTGVNVGLSATVGSASTGVLNFIRPLLNAPSTGDTFTISFGCDHTRGTCASRFSNLANYRGYDFVPPPIQAI